MRSASAASENGKKEKFAEPKGMQMTLQLKKKKKKDSAICKQMLLFFPDGIFYATDELCKILLREIF